MAYLIVEPGMAAGKVRKAEPIKRDNPKIAAEYALAGQYMGMKLVYLEAGSGAPTPVAAEMIKEVKNNINVPLVVGGGIRSSDQAKEAVSAGADIIVTGTITEENFDKVKEIIKAVKEARK